MPRRPWQNRAVTGFRPWDQVAAEYTRRTGRPMTAANARMTETKALRKLRRQTWLLAWLRSIRDGRNGPTE